MSILKMQKMSVYQNGVGLILARCHLNYLDGFSWNAKLHVKVIPQYLQKLLKEKITVFSLWSEFCFIQTLSNTLKESA